MASKQLGKFRQWAGEVISVRDKTIVTDEFRELEHDIELRRRGLSKLHTASEDYQSSLSKKKEFEVVDGDEKLLAIDALGVVMIQHGEEFGDDSAFGTSLVSLGRAHCQVAALQEAFSLNFDESYLTSIRKAEDEIKEYQTQRKKLESRRLTYDAAITKAEKIRNSKKEKEKDRMEAEDELLKAKSRYEETAEDVRARMYVIQENELELLRALTGFLDDETHFVEQYLEVLKEVKAGWIDEATLSQMESARKRRPPPRPVGDSRFSSMRSIKSASKHSLPGSNGSDSNSNDEMHPQEGRISRALSLRKADSPSHNRTRSRANSTATARSFSEKEKDEKTDREDKTEKDKKKRSMTGWASSKVSSLTHRGKKDKVKSKAKFGSLMDDQDDLSSDEEEERESDLRGAPGTRTPSIRSSSHHSTPTIPPALPSRMLKLSSQQQGKKVVMALHDFASGSSDELSFRAGEQIVVLNEVLDGWWMGELDGKTGLFPTTYTEVISAPAESAKPPLPRRPSPVGQPSPLQSDDEQIRMATQAPRWLTAADTGGYSMQSDDEEHPFGDNYMAPMRVPEGAFDAESIVSSVNDYDENERLVASDTDQPENGAYTYASPRAQAPTPAPPRPPLPLRSTSVKKPPPPPPPPRRATMTTLSTNPPPIPSRPGIARSSSSSQTNSISSTNASFVTVATTTATPVLKGEELTFSPFDSPKDTTFTNIRGCSDFKQHPFKSPGACANCSQMHL